jgi:hypothetical protein
VIEFKVSSFCSMGNCVEVGAAPGGGIAVRDSKRREAGHVVFPVEEWRSFLVGVRAGEFDRA